MLRTVADHDHAGTGAQRGGRNRVREDQRVWFTDIFDRTTEILINPCDGAWGGHERAVPDHGDVRIDADRRHTRLRRTSEVPAVGFQRHPGRVRSGKTSKAASCGRATSWKSSDEKA